MAIVGRVRITKTESIVFFRLLENQKPSLSLEAKYDRLEAFLSNKTNEFDGDAKDFIEDEMVLLLNEIALSKG